MSLPVVVERRRHGDRRRQAERRRVVRGASPDRKNDSAEWQFEAG